ncbi:NADH dehydrogenase [ubiquinone] iron-sulfur protein 5-B isoform X1 [Aristolochia californica]|uniref:NADH dehydrogenase [ubiquinone] iron-sulfur protein 5-B isoform X1 n=1 Tax=Aristolochia californica TaxID=171875 RepID=UPI0035E2BCCD
MASGWGITGNKGRCYDFWTDFSECMSRCREPKDCALLREDYLECLHHAKEVYLETAHMVLDKKHRDPFTSYGHDKSQSDSASGSSFFSVSWETKLEEDDL